MQFQDCLLVLLSSLLTGLIHFIGFGRWRSNMISRSNRAIKEHIENELADGTMGQSQADLIFRNTSDLAVQDSTDALQLSDHSESGSGIGSAFTRSGGYVISRAPGQVRKFGPDLRVQFPEPVDEIQDSRI